MLQQLHLFFVAVINLLLGDNIDHLRQMDDNTIDAIVTDPPYGISFAGKKWDYDVPTIELWQECLRVLKPGGHALIACGTRTQHRMVCNIEDAGFEIRDVVSWLYGSGFPKSLDVSKAIDKMDATKEQFDRRHKFTNWVRSQGVKALDINKATKTQMGSHYTTQASQPFIMTRKHLEACRHLFKNVPKWVEDECDQRSVESKNFNQREIVGSRVGNKTVYKTIGKKGTRCEISITAPATDEAKKWDGWGTALKPACEFFTLCRKPIKQTTAQNVLAWGTGAINIDGCRWGVKEINKGRWPTNVIHDGSDHVLEGLRENARFFYCPKASPSERDEGNIHPTVKPVELMRYLVRLITPPRGTVMDPFMGSGTTGVAAKIENMDFVGMELSDEYLEICKRRIENKQCVNTLF